MLLLVCGLSAELLGPLAAIKRETERRREQRALRVEHHAVSLSEHCAGVGRDDWSVKLH